MLIINLSFLFNFIGSEISIQITANPIVNAIESTLTNVLKRGDDKNRKDKLHEEPCTPEPDLQEIKNMLNYCKTISPAPANKPNKSINRQPPPIPPRRPQMNGSATFVRGKRTPGQQLPVHIPGIACRTLNAPNQISNKHNNNNNSSGNSSPNNSMNNSINNSPVNSSSSSKQVSPVSSPSISLSSSSDSGIQNEFRIEETLVEEKHLITNPFLTQPEEQLENRSGQVRSVTMVDNAIPLTKPRSFTRPPPSYFQPSSNETKNEDNAGSPIHSNQSTNQRKRIIPPRSIFEEMNYNEIVNYIDNMEESEA